MKLITTRYFQSSKVRQMCIEHNYCTGCDCFEYDQLLLDCTGNKTDDEILTIATMIFKYSNTKKLMSEAGCSEKELLSAICFNLLNDCCYIITEIED